MAQQFSRDSPDSKPRPALDEDHSRTLECVGGRAATRVDDRYNCDAGKRDALDRWARGLTAIIEGKTKKVVAFRA